MVAIQFPDGGNDIAGEEFRMSSVWRLLKKCLLVRDIRIDHPQWPLERVGGYDAALSERPIAVRSVSTSRLTLSSLAVSDKAASSDNLKASISGLQSV
jgi:hypothetical protein